MYQVLKRFIFTTLMLVPLLVAQGAPTQAITLSLDPVMQTVNPGDPVLVALNISGLGSGGPDSLGAFDVDVGYDPALLSFTGLTFGTGLDVLGFGSVNGFADLGSVVDLFEVSLDTVSDLDTFQPAAFTLATLNFDAIGVGTSLLTLSNVVLSDALGFELEATINGASATVVPLPAALPLFAGGLGLLGLFGWRRRRLATA